MAIDGISTLCGRGMPRPRLYTQWAKPLNPSTGVVLYMCTVMLRLRSSIGRQRVSTSARAGTNRCIGHVVLSASVPKSKSRFSSTIQNNGSAIRYSSGRSSVYIGDVTLKFTASNVRDDKNERFSATVSLRDGPLARITISSGFDTDTGSFDGRRDIIGIFTILKSVCCKSPPHLIILFSLFIKLTKNNTASKLAKKNDN